MMIDGAFRALREGFLVMTALGAVNLLAEGFDEGVRQRSALERAGIRSGAMGPVVGLASSYDAPLPEKIGRLLGGMLAMAPLLALIVTSDKASPAAQKERAQIAGIIYAAALAGVAIATSPEPEPRLLDEH